VNDRVVWVSGAQSTSPNHGRRHDVEGRTRSRRRLAAVSDVHAVDANTAWLLTSGTEANRGSTRRQDAGTNWTLQYTNPDSAGFYDCMDFWDAQRGIVIGDALGPTSRCLRRPTPGALDARSARIAAARTA
jgi:hypothetical protein